MLVGKRLAHDPRHRATASVTFDEPKLAQVTIDDAAKADRALRAVVALGEGRNEEAYELGLSNGTDYTQRTTVIVAAYAAFRLQRWDDAVRNSAVLES